MANNEIKMNEVMVDFGLIGLVVLGIGAVGALGYGVYKFVKAKKDAKKVQELAKYDGDATAIEYQDFEPVETDE